jgi:uncharacterized protein YkwD
MRHIRILAVVSFSTLALALLPGSAVASPRDSMLAQINSVRAYAGVHPLRSSRALNDSSSRFAGTLMRRDFFGHASRIRAGGRFRLLGEILEMHRGSRPQVGATVRAWLNSPGHRRVIMDPRFYWIGLGRVAGRFNGHRTTIWVGQFGRK